LKPKILIDGVALLFPLTGIGRYTYEVANILQKQEEFELNYFYGYYSKKLLKSTVDLLQNSSESETLVPKKARLKPSFPSFIRALVAQNPILKKIARILLRLSTHLFSSKYNLYWQPNFIPNGGVKADKIVTSVHDFSFIHYRDFHPKERIEYIERYFFKNVAKSDMLITGSYFTKEEIVNYLNFSEEKIAVIYHGIDHNLFKIYQEPKVDFELPKKYILSVGSIEPRKNLIGLLKAYALLEDKLKAEYKLVLVGFKGWENREIMKIIKENEKSIFYLGFISDEELAKVYNLASLFVFPSFYEGFGLPPLEAMACGTPVISSNSSSLPEVGGDAVVYCDPKDSLDIKEKIAMVLNDKNLQKEMIDKGLKQAKKFSWEKSAKEHTRVFKEVLKR